MRPHVRSHARCAASSRPPTDRDRRARCSDDGALVRRQSEPGQAFRGDVVNLAAHTTVGMLVHAAHRLRFTLHDGLQLHRYDTLIATACSGGALASPSPPSRSILEWPYFYVEMEQPA